MRKNKALLREARRQEQFGDYEAAISSYRKLLQLQEEEDGFADLGLYNRLGDLYLRIGNPRTAVECFERALERQEEEHLYANAIALCKKILRNAPTYTEMYRRTGQLQTLAGLHGAARESYIEYANRREREGSPELALEALEEFADRSGDEEIRLALADRLLLADRNEEALAHLRLVYRSRLERKEDASEIRERIAEIDPDVDPLSDAPGLEEPAVEPAGDGDGRPMGDGDGSPMADGDGSPAADGEEDVAQLAADLQEVLNRLAGEEKLRQALPVIDQLLQIEPGQMHLLQRKLQYALELGEERAAIDAYLAMGGLLEKRLNRFSLRLLTTSFTDDEGATCALKVEERVVSAPAD